MGVSWLLGDGFLRKREMHMELWLLVPSEEEPAAQCVECDQCAASSDSSSGLALALGSLLSWGLNW